MGYYQTHWHGYANPDRELRPWRAPFSSTPPLKPQLKYTHSLGVYERKPWHDGLPIPGPDGLQ